LPEDIILKKKLVAAMLELMATKDKDEGLKEEVAICIIIWVLFFWIKINTMTPSGNLRWING